MFTGANPWPFDYPAALNAMVTWLVIDTDIEIRRPESVHLTPGAIALTYHGETTTGQQTTIVDVQPSLTTNFIEVRVRLDLGTTTIANALFILKAPEPLSPWTFLHLRVVNAPNVNEVSLDLLG